LGLANSCDASYPIVIDPRAIEWRAGSEVRFKTARFFSAAEEERRFAAPLRIPKMPCRPTTRDERGAILWPCEKSGGSKEE
jgi:hypothetical protein